MFLFAIASLLFLNSCGVQWMVTVGAGGQVGGGGQYPTQQQGQQQPCNGSYGNGGYYGYQNPNPPRITTPGIRQCPQP